MADKPAVDKRINDQLGWTLTEHCCRVCFGRVLSRKTVLAGKTTFKCACCDTEVEGDGPQVLCACGIKLRGTRDAGIRCRMNDRRTPENPSSVIAEQISTPQ